MPDTIVLKIKISQGADGTLYKDHELIKFAERMTALRFMYEIYEAVGAETEYVSGLRVNDKEKVAIGVRTNHAIYELVE